MRSSKLRAGLDKISPARPADAPASPLSATALASALDLNEGSNRLAEAREIALEQIRPDPDQPRKSFPDASLEALAASIREQGVLQPITVTPDADGYRIVAGERRWRASQLAGLERIPALVRHLSDRDRRIVALMENLQREDLNDIDRARGLADLRETLAAQSPGIASHDLDEEVGKRLGISGRSVRNFLGLLQLSEPVQDAIAGGSLTEKHGRALRRIPEPELQGRVAEAVTTHKLTGEDTRVLVEVMRENSRLDVDRMARMTKSGELMERMKKAVAAEKPPASEAIETLAPEEVEIPANGKEKASLPLSQANAMEASLERVEAEVRRLEKLANAAEDGADYRQRMEGLANRLLRLAQTAEGEGSGNRR